MKKYTIIAIIVCTLFIIASYIQINFSGPRNNLLDSQNDIMQKENEIDTIKSSLGTAIFANGCFWCAEHDLEKVKGVSSVMSGYTEGKTDNPTYKDYGPGGHREAVLVTYDPKVVSYANLVEFTLKHGDPTDSEGSYYDRGFQYSPAIYYANESEKSDAEKVVKGVNDLKVFEKPINIAILPRVKFWPAEDYHQDYGSKNPIRYAYYRNASGRDAFIKKYWGDKANEYTVSGSVNSSANTGTESSKGNEAKVNANANANTGTVKANSVEYNANSWVSFVKPPETKLKSTLNDVQYDVTQEEGTERPFSNEYDKNYEEGIYVDIVSGEPLYFSKDKFDSGTGWPSFVKPIAPEVLVLKEDRHFFTTRTEVRSRYADSHLGHVFDDGPKDRGGLRYCMNSAAMKFIARADMEKLGYGYLIPEMDK